MSSALREKLAARKKNIANLLSSIGVSVPSLQTPSGSQKRSSEEATSTNLASDTEIGLAEETVILEAVSSFSAFPVTGPNLKHAMGATLGTVKDVDILTVLKKFAAQGLLQLQLKSTRETSLASTVLLSTNSDKILTRLTALKSAPSSSTAPAAKVRKTDEAEKTDKNPEDTPKNSEIQDFDSVEALLKVSSTKERESKKISGEILELISKPSAKERVLIDRFRSAEGTQVNEFCAHSTKEDCAKVSQDGKPCKRLHFIKIIQAHTDISLGDCSFLNTCFHMETCKFIHYRVDYSTLGKRDKEKEGEMRRITSGQNLSDVLVKGPPLKMYPPQWIQCDLRAFELSVLGKFSVVMADPPWDIHMELPYGTMADDEMRKLDVASLQTDGLIFLWVTGRAMELGRDCLSVWGYEQVDELIWVKTNQLQRIIRTGRTGHWLNHGKEHCLIGRKGSLSTFNVGLDCDVLVSEVRATSHKPDELYGLIERLAPGHRKVELFGRMHNCQPNWITLGNQLDGVRILDPDVVGRFKETYPDGNCMPKPKNQMPDKNDGNPPIPGL